MKKRACGILGYATLLALSGAGGCGGDARVELSAADALAAVAERMDLVIAEYHADVRHYDDLRETEVVAAFIERVRRTAADETAVDRHAVQFKDALARIRTDRDTERTRRDTAHENVRALREVAGGLRRLAIESLTLDDEMRRYLSGWFDMRRAAQAAVVRREVDDE